MSEMKNGGPAFPGTQTWVAYPAENGAKEFHAPMNGMSLRDYFAAAALTGRLANHRLTGPDDYNGELVQDCWAVADKMLAERSKR